MGDHNFSIFQRQLGQRIGRRCRRRMLVFRSAPTDASAAAASCCLRRRSDRPWLIANRLRHREQPRRRTVGNLAALGQLDERLLHDLVAIGTPLPRRLQLQCRSVAVQQFRQQLGRWLRHSWSPLPASVAVRHTCDDELQRSRPPRPNYLRKIWRFYNFGFRDFR